MTRQTDHDSHEHPILDEPRPGQDLRAARERAGISRESMAERLRLAPAQLDALERDDYAELPPPAFVRGYFRAYARELRLDPEEYIAAYNRSGVSSQDPEIRSGGVTDTASSGRGGMIGLILIALIAAGGLGAWWYQHRGVDNGDGSDAAQPAEEQRASEGEAENADPQDEPAVDAEADGDARTDEGDATAAGDAEATSSGEDDDTAAAAESDGPSPDTQTEPVDVAAADAALAAADDDPTNDADEDTDDTGGDDAGTADAEEEPPTVAAPDRESLETAGDEPVEDATTVAAAEAGASGGDGDDAAATGDEGDTTGDDDQEPGATSPAATDSPIRAATEAAGSGPDEVTLEFSARSWLEVYDDRDRELVYTLYFGSEPITLQGWAPFEIFLGNSPAVTVRFNGEEVDKSAFTRGNNTARFLVDSAGARGP